MSKAEFVGNGRGGAPNKDSQARAPKTSRGKARVGVILAAARALFIQGGYPEMTMRRVAESVGMTLSNLQHYFPSREALLQAMLDEVMVSYDPTYEGLLAGIKDPTERLVAVVRYLIKDCKKAETEKLFVEIWSLATRDPMVRAIFDRMYSHHRGNFEKLVAAANPILSTRQISTRSALIAMQIEGLMLLISEAKPKHRELQGIEEECIDAIMRIVGIPVKSNQNG